MKKKEKPLESPSIRIYEHVVKRIFLNNLGWLLVGGLFIGRSLAASTPRPTFVVLESADTFEQTIKNIEDKGGAVRQRIPPSIFIADIPSHLSMTDFAKTKFAFTSVFPVSNLESYGPIAVAAGLQWNRKFVREAQAAGAKSMGSMRVLVAKNSLPAPANVRIQIEESHLLVTWDGMEGAAYYEVETAFNGSFTDPWVRTHSNVSSVPLPAPLDHNGTIFLRVRGIDHMEGTHKSEDDIFGSWSTPIRATISPNSDGTRTEPPSLSSPLNNQETEGYTLILEWQDNSTAHYRLQMARDNAFTDILIDEFVETKEFPVPSQALHVGDALFWRVQKYGNESSSWSDVRRIRIGFPKHNVTDMFVDPSAP